MFTKKHQLPFKMLALSAVLLPSIAYSGESCNALLNLGLYNVSQSSSAADGQAMSLSTFCSADYSSSSTTSERKAAIKGSYGLFSAGASGSISDSEIIIKQSNVCTSGFNNSAYSSQASAYSQNVYQGTLDAWNKCQALSKKNLDFEVWASSTLQGVTVIVTPAAGVRASFNGLYQDGAGSSVCKRTLPPSAAFPNGKVMVVDEASSFKITSAQKLTINCKRKMQKDLQGNLSADAQDLIFVTSADSLRVPMAAVGNLARATVDKVKTDIQDSVAKDTNIYLGSATQNLTNSTNDLINKTKAELKNSIDHLDSRINGISLNIVRNPNVYDIANLGGARDCDHNQVAYGFNNSPGSTSSLDMWRCATFELLIPK